MKPSAPERSPGIVRVLGELGGALRGQLPPPAGRPRAERALPPGELGFSLARTHRF